MNVHVHFGLYINASPYFLRAFFLGALALLSVFFDRLLVGGGGITSPRRPSLSSSGRSSVTFASLQATLLQFELHLRQVKTCAANGTQRFQTYLASVERQQVSLTALDVATQNLKDLMAS